MKLFRVILPNSDIEEAVKFYRKVFDKPGERASPGRHYFDCDGVILACYDPKADGDKDQFRPNPEHIYFATKDLDGLFKRVAEFEWKRIESKIYERPWGERSFYCTDPFENNICFVEEETCFKAG